MNSDDDKESSNDGSAPPENSQVRVKKKWYEEAIALPDNVEDLEDFDYEPAFEDPEEIRYNYYSKLYGENYKDGDSVEGAADTEEGENLDDEDYEKYLGYPVYQIAHYAQRRCEQAKLLGVEGLRRDGTVGQSRETGGFDASSPTGSFKLDVPNIKGLKAMYPSAPFFAVMTPWRVVVRPYPPKGKAKYIGAYIACDAKSSNKDWNINTDCELRIYRPNGTFMTKTFKHLYVEKKREKGIDQFVSMSDLKQYLFRDKGLVEGIVNCQPPKNVEWDSRKITGYVGIINQGATCYMNALLQALFATAEFRYDIYKVPTEFDIKKKSPAQGMQRMFYDLQFGAKAADSVKLTDSFNWTRDDAMIQQDIQEFLRMLLDRLGERMIGTRLEGSVDRLFGGETINYTRCTKVDWKNEKTEPYQDVGLNIKGKKTIIDSFHDYTKVQKCKGADKIQTEDYGPQEGVKGVVFKYFPPVLYLILGRISFDMKLFKFSKINDKIIFPLKIDLTKFVDKAEEKQIFHLSSVLVHIGDANAGHYLVYVDPKCEGKWRKFDDDNVSLATRKEAVDDMFGGKGTRENPMKGMTNAYMLVYFADKELSVLTRDIALAEIPEEIVAIFESEKAEDEVLNRQWMQRYNFIVVRVLTEAAFASHQKTDLYDVKKPRGIDFKVLKTELVTNFFKRCQSAFGYDANSIRLWPIAQREGHLTMRPKYLNYEEEGNMTLTQMSNRKPQWSCFVEFADAGIDTSLPNHDPNSACYCWFKFFDPKASKMTYIGCKSIPHNCSTSMLKATCQKMAKLPEDSYIELYFETNPDKVEYVNLWGFSRVFKIVEKPEDGEIFVFMLWTRGTDFDFANPTDFLLDQSSQLPVLYCDTTMKPKDRGIKIETSIKFKYNQIARFLARNIGVEASHLKFYKPNPTVDKASEQLNPNYEGDIQELFERFDNRKPKKLYYEVLPVPLKDLDSREKFTVYYIDNLYVETTEITVYPPKGSNVRALLDEVKKDFDVEIGERAGSKEFRLVDVTASKITRVFENKTPLSNLQATKKYRAEEILSDEINVPSNACLMQVIHFHRNPATLHGHPFFIRVEEGEDFAEFLTKLQERNAITDVDFGLYKFAIVKGNKADYVTAKDYPKIKIKDFKSHFDCFFGMDHTKKFRLRKRPAGVVKKEEDVRMKIG